MTLGPNNYIWFFTSVVYFKVISKFCHTAEIQYLVNTMTFMVFILQESHPLINDLCDRPFLIRNRLLSLPKKTPKYQ